ncbi:MAG TPA: ABC transporter permease [Vicinamibacterales bacterium]|nr:ABC transporter permease [Vicinamibacterales bacterium]
MTIEPFVHDVRLAWRGLWRSTGFTAAAVLTLAVGMAGVTSMFALIQGVLLRPLPMPAADRIVTVWKEHPSTASAHWPFNSAELALIRNGATHVFASVAAVGYNEPAQSEIVDESSATYINTARVSGDFFDVLGVRSFLGRTLNRGDDTAGSERVLVITHGLWQRRYGGAVDVIGRRLTINEQRFTIVGVMPPDVEYPRGADAWMTVEARATLTSNSTFQQATRNELDLIARLQPSVTVTQAASALGAIAPQLAETAPVFATAQPPISVVRPIGEVIVGDVRGGMLVLFGAVALVLLAASANVANLLLVRGEIRRPDLAVQTALGASRLRLAGTIVSESLVLSFLAGIVGFAATWASLRALVAMAPGGLPRVDAIHMDGGVALFVMALSLVTTILSALVPAFAAGRIDLVSHVQSGGRAVTRGTKRGRAALVTAQVALAVTVVAAAGLVARSLLRLQSTGTELGADRLVMVSLALPQDRYGERERHLRFLEDVVARLEATPTIAAVTPINAMPFSGVGWDVPIVTAEGQNPAEVAANGSVNLEAIQPSYFETFGVAVNGRPFDRRDREDAPAVAIVSVDVASRLWPGQDPIGKRLKMGDLDSKDTWRTVVGVASRTRYRDLRTPQATLYVPDTQLIVTAQSLVVRSTAPLSQVAEVVRNAVRASDPAVRVPRVAPFGELLREPLARPRFYTFVLGVFGLSALLLCGIGLYAVIAASVRQRYAEIGVRLAVGASPADVRGMILREGMLLAGGGAAAGLVLALVVTQFLRGLLYEVHPLDPIALVTATILLLAAAVVASYLPARTAARMDPLRALRE